MKLLRFKPVGTETPRSCPRCGSSAARHGRLRRVIDDWEVTFVDCQRLRCCGRTFVSAPPGLTARSRYSDRVVGLSRALAAIGIPYRHCSDLMREAGVRVTPQSIQSWCRGVPRRECGVAALTPAPEGDVAVELRDGLWMSIGTDEPESVLSVLDLWLDGIIAPHSQRRHHHASGTLVVDPLDRIVGCRAGTA